MNAVPMLGQAVAQSPSARSTQRGLRWRRVLGHGVLWGVAAGAMESFALPLSEIPAVELQGFLTLVLLQWCVTGVVLVAAATLLERRLVGSNVALFLVAFAALASAAWWIAVPAWRPENWLEGQSVHVFWGALFYGGLYVAAYRLNARSERTRTLLARAEIERQRTQAALSVESLRSLEGQVDPAFLLRVMTEAERRYVSDRAGVDRLLGPLVGFLRAAMPGVRGRASTLQDEVELAVLYATVLAELEPNRIAWEFDVPERLPELPFPSLMLLPVMDCLSSTAPAGSRATLRVRRGVTTCRLSMGRVGLAPGPWLAPELAYRLRIGLHELFGADWTLAVHAGTAHPAFELALPIGALPRPASLSPPFDPSTKEMNHE